MDDKDIYRRLPEILRIEDDKIFTGVENLFQNHVPEYFWEAPASTSGKYHPVDETGEHGLWLHTKRVSSVYERLVRSLEEQDRVSQYDIDCGRAAVLAHDAFRLGETDEGEEHSVDDHGEIAAQKCSEAGLNEIVSNAVRAHDGSWGEGKSPGTDLEDVVHYADMVASERGIHISVLNPHETLYRIDTVEVKDYIGIPRYEENVEEVASDDLVYAFGCEDTRFGWRVFLKSPYEAKDDIKELENRWWNDEARMWMIPPEEYEFSLNKLREDGWRVETDSRVEDFVTESL